jgi:putative phosphoribosyl transferase
VEALESLVDEMVCPLRPDPFHAVGVWYEHFDQTSDAEVRRCLAEAELQPHP